MTASNVPIYPTTYGYYFEIGDKQLEITASLDKGILL